MTSRERLKEYMRNMEVHIFIDVDGQEHVSKDLDEALTLGVAGVSTRAGGKPMAVYWMRLKSGEYELRVNEEPKEVLVHSKAEEKIGETVFM